MKILIHQAICGQVEGGGWGLLSTTLQDKNIVKNIVYRTDLQDQTRGIHWIPAIRGFCESDYYLIMRTFDDTSSDVRNGRKFTHVLIISIENIIKIENLKPIIYLLPTRIDKNPDLKPIMFEMDNKTEKIIPSVIQQGRFNKLINGYINIKSYKNTLIWIGQEYFETVVVEFWKCLMGNERAIFQFGISFNNDNKESAGISLISVPESVQSKFNNSDFFIIGKSDDYIPNQVLEKLLVGDALTKKRIHDFETTIDSGTLDRDAINLIAKGLETFEQLEKIDDIKKLNTLSHIIAQYAPTEKQGEQYKQKLLSRIADLVQDANYTDITVLRHFKTNSYRNAKKILEKALTDWLKKSVFSNNKKNTINLDFFIQFEIKSNNWWEKIIEDEMSTYLQTINLSKMAIIYSWLQQEPSILSIITPFFNRSNDTESYFIKKLPAKISPTLNKELEKICMSNSWWNLYATILNHHLIFEDAITELIKMDQDIGHFDSINIIIKGKKPKLIIDYAINNSESRMQVIAGELCHDSPKYLSNINVQNSNWRAIWLEAIRRGNNIGDGINDPKKMIEHLFDLLISGEHISDELLERISQSEYSDILLYTKRSQLWGRFSPHIKENFLKHTSTSLLKLLSENSTTDIPEDVVLLNYISHKGLADFLYFNRSNIKNVLPLFEKFPQLDDANLRDYLNNYNGQISAIDATQLGRLIERKAFKMAASVVNNRASKKNNWIYALEVCHYILSFIDKGILAISGELSNVKIPTAEWWQSAEDLIIELYPNSASLTTIWKKAGGKESDLLMHTSAADAWNNALFKLRKNHLDKITMNSLLREIRKQYGKNEKFKIIYDLRKNYIKT